MASHRATLAALEQIRPTCIAGSRAAKVSSRGEDTPNAPRAFADPLAVVLLALFVGGGASLTGKIGFFLLWLSIWSVGVVGLIHAAMTAWRFVAVGEPAAGRLLAVGGAVFITLIATVFVAAEVFVIFLVAQMTSLWLIPFLVGIVAINASMYELIKAPTGKGRAIMDSIDGFRMYLAAAVVAGERWPRRRLSD